LRGFFSTAPEGIAESQKLALELAKRSHFLRDFLDSELRRQEKEPTERRLYGLYQVFRDQVFHELTLGEFADAFAQMLAYGLFLAKLNSNGEEITLANARQFVPGSFRLIRELVEFLYVLTAPEYSEIRWVVDELLSIVNGLDLHAIHEDLSFKRRKAISRKVRAQDGGGAPPIRARSFHLLLRGFSRQIRRQDEKGARRLLYAAADRELHRACSG
jgi:hypothetical protein